jgi:hypothetical protein
MLRIRRTNVLQRIRFHLVLAVLLLFGSPQLHAQTPQPFSADFVTTTAQAQKMAGKWYVAMPKMRMDITSMPQQGSAGGGSMSMIIDSTTQTSYMLMPQQQMYMEFHADRQDNSTTPELRDMLHFKGGSDPCANDPDKTCKKIGKETVKGRSCDKWEVTDKGSRKSTLWMDQKLHFPIKFQSNDGMLLELSNIKEGAPDPALFVIPPGYKLFDPSALQKP